MSRETDEDGVVLVPGMLLDAQNHIVLVLIASDAVHISIKRYDEIPDIKAITKALMRDQWVAVYKDSSYLYLMEPEGDSITSTRVKKFKGPQANESAQFAIEVALCSWKDWGSDYRELYKPRLIIPRPAKLPEA